MAVPLGTVALAVGGGVLIKLAWDKFFGKKVENLMAPLPGATTGAMVTTMVPNQAYVLDALVDSASFASNDPQNNAQPIADALASSGMTPLARPQPRDPQQTAAFQAKQPSRWMAIFRWTGTGAMPGAVPGFVKQFNIYGVPAGV
jgi:hypothetical protein